MKKSLTTGLYAAGFVLFLIYMSIIIKLIMLGPVPYASDLGPSFLPFGRIEISPDGFSIQNKIGSIVLPIIVGGAVAIVHYLLRGKSSNRGSKAVSQS